jgi:hypothetical protein
MGVRVSAGEIRRTVIARSEATRQSRSRRIALDSFASLAKTATGMVPKLEQLPKV